MSLLSIVRCRPRRNKSFIHLQKTKNKPHKLLGAERKKNHSIQNEDKWNLGKRLGSMKKNRIPSKRKWKR